MKLSMTRKQPSFSQASTKRCTCGLHCTQANSVISKPMCSGGHVRLLSSHWPMRSANVRIFERADREVHREAGGLAIPDRPRRASPSQRQQPLHHERIERRAFLALRRLGDERGRHFVASGIAARAGQHFVATRAAAGAQLDQLLHVQHQVPAVSATDIGSGGGSVGAWTMAVSLPGVGSFGNGPVS